MEIPLDNPTERIVPDQNKIMKKKIKIKIVRQFPNTTSVRSQQQRAEYIEWNIIKNMQASVQEHSP